MQLVLGVAGAVVGGFFGGATGAQLGWMIGSTLGGFLDRPDGTVTEGPKLTDTRVTISTYGAMIPKLWGTAPVAGNIIDASDKRETAHYETQGGKGPPESTSVTYTYDVDLDIYICEGEIDGIVRVWANENLIYDAGTNDAFLLAEVNKNVPFTLYVGSETQTADPTFETLHGAGNVPAYRGIAHVVFSAFQLAPYGNQIPTFRFEVVKTGSGAYPSNLTGIPANTNVLAPMVDRAHRYIYWPHGTFTITDRDSVIATVTGLNSPLAVAMDEDGDILSMGQGGATPVIKRFRNGVVVSEVEFPTEGADSPWILASSPGGGNMKAVVTLGGTDYLATFDGTSFTTYAAISAPGGSDLNLSVSPSGNAVLVDIGSAVWIWENNSVPAQLSLVGSPTPNYVMGCWGADDKIYLWDDQNNRVDVYDTTGAFVTTITPTNGATIDRAHMGIDFDGTVWLWRGLYLYTFSAGAIARTLGPLSAEPTSASGTGLMFIAENGLIYVRSGIRVTPFQYLTSGSVFVSEALQDISNDVDIATNQLTLTDTDTIPLEGYVIASYGTAGAAVQQLQKAFFFDMVETGGKIKAVSRGGASVVTIDGDSAGGHRDGEDRPRGPFEIIHANDLEAPQVVHVAFLDKDNHYQPGTQSDTRIITASTESAAEDFPIVMTNSKALQVAQVGLYTAWQERNRFTVNLPFGYIYLEPGDVIVLSDDVKSFTVRIVRIGIENTLLKLQCVQDDHGGYAAAPVGAEPQAATIDYVILEDAVAMLLDIPLLSPFHDHPGFYFAAGNWNSDNPGAELFAEDTSGAQQSLGIIRNLATVGYCQNEAENWGSPETIDEWSALQVLILGDKTLSSCAYDELLAWSNHAAYGVPGRWEIIQFRTATLGADNIYTLTGLMRGRCGTEWAIALHNDGDYFVKLDEGVIADIRQSSAAIGVEADYRAVTFGKNVIDTAPISFTNNQMRLKPYSPAQLNAARDWLTGTWTATWSRRTRYYGTWDNLHDVPLNEDTEAYRAVWFSGAALTLSSVSRTEDAVFETSSAHGLSVADRVFIHGTSGSMVEINERAYQVTQVVSTTKFRVGLDTRHYTAYTSGGSVLRSAQETLTTSESDTYAPGSPTVTTVGLAVCQRSGIVGDGVYANALITQG